MGEYLHWFVMAVVSMGAFLMLFTSILYAAVKAWSFFRYLMYKPFRPVRYISKQKRFTADINKKKMLPLRLTLVTSDTKGQPMGNINFEVYALPLLDGGLGGGHLLFKGETDAIGYCSLRKVIDPAIRTILIVIEAKGIETEKQLKVGSGYLYHHFH